MQIYSVRSAGAAWLLKADEEHDKETATASTEDVGSATGCREAARGGCRFVICWRLLLHRRSHLMLPVIFIPSHKRPSKYSTSLTVILTKVPLILNASFYRS
ncbi:hypothetical protein E2562_012054 [Oryza meyeriana var. granulata]|uniref:Uncharacterized protein n=1 Tax=Oryza meyeriana var. granulata TaxID=110450 RepID=A0A6G1D3B3_9ORYZ|nr:hypothetical protein E2562_012054 [Oryza meyeriana var. granulata]